MINLKYDLLMIISSGGAVVSVYHVNSWYTSRSHRRMKHSISERGSKAIATNFNTWRILQHTKNTHVYFLLYTYILI